MDIKMNKLQTPLTEELKESLPREVWEEVLEYISTVKFIQNLIAPEEVRGYAKDKPRETEFYNDGRVQVDLTTPHILENMDFFREKALFYEQNGRYTNLVPNGNPKSEYAQFWKEELHKWRYGLVRESDGEWIPGYLYFYWNYSPIWLIESDPSNINISSKKGNRVRKFPKPWLGDYLFFHYLEQCRDNGKHAKNLKSRGIGMSFKNAAMSPRNMYVFPGTGNANFHLANEKSFLAGDKGIFGKILDCLDWIADTTPFAKLRLQDSKREMQIQLGYQDEHGIRKGLLSSVQALSLKDNPDKARGVRGVFCHYEEDGLFDNLEKAWNVNRPAFEDGGVAFGLMLAAGTGGVEGGSFEGSEKLFYSPAAYNIYGIPNVFDKNTSGDTICGHFWAAYLNRNGCYEEENGEPDVIKAMIEICQERHVIKYSASDANALTQKKAELPITPQEAVMRTEGTVFPVSDLKEYLESIAIKKESFLAEHYVGDLIHDSKGDIIWKPNDSKFPLRAYDIASGDKTGCLEIFEMPRKNADGRVVRGRYIAGIDPIDSDTGQSLFSVLVMDTFTDRIVAEYSGRPRTANEAYEIALRTLIFYNAEANYESNLKGLFSYFDNKNMLHYLADTPQILKDQDLVKSTNLFGNKAHPYTEKIYTPTGIREWGDMKVGDYLFGSNGNVTKIIDIPFDDVTNIYEISLKDGRKVRASSNHLWNVIDWSGRLKTLSTSDIMNNYYRNKGKYKEYKYYIPANKGVDFEKVNVKIPPYLLGLGLGDGCFTNSRYNNLDFTSSLKDIKHYKKYLECDIHTKDDRHHSIRFKDMGKCLKYYGLHDKKSRTKFIPDDYKFNSRKVRLELLKGLLDTDGTVGKDGNATFTSTSKQLQEDVTEVARSLGINCNNTEYTNKFGKVYMVRFYTDIKLFKLKRKYELQRITKTRAFKTAITNIQLVNKELSKCVTVDAADNCYLINDFILTHNSKGTRASAPVNAWGRLLQADWQRSKAQGDDDDSRLNLHRLRSLAYIEECIKWNSDGNFDRVSAGIMLFILREDRVKRTASAKINGDKPRTSLANDAFFTRNFKSNTSTDDVFKIKKNE